MMTWSEEASSVTNQGYTRRLLRHALSCSGACAHPEAFRGHFTPSAERWRRDTGADIKDIKAPPRAGKVKDPAISDRR